MDITRVGFGAWAIGGGGWLFAWGEQDDAESVAAIRHAAERGVNWIDTAAVYGNGHSEEVVARALREMPAGERPYVFTKCGLVWDEKNPMVQAKRIGEASSLRREVEASLRRLGVERIDLYQMHWPAEDGTPDRGLLAHAAGPEGRGQGAGGRPLQPQRRPARRGGACRARGHAAAAVLRDPARRRARPCFPGARRTGPARSCTARCRRGCSAAASPPSGPPSCPADDWRSRTPEFQGEKLQRNLALADALGAIARRHDTTVGAVAVAWTLAWPGVTAAIVGARRPSQIDGWIDAARLELTAADLDEVAAAIARTGAGTGPTPARGVLSRGPCPIALPPRWPSSPASAPPAGDRSLRFSRRHLFVGPYESATVGDLDRDGRLDIVYGPYWFAAPDFAPRAVPPEPHGEGVSPHQQRTRAGRGPGRLAGHHRRRLGRRRPLLVPEPRQGRGRARHALEDARAVGRAAARTHARPHGDVRAARLRRGRRARAALRVLPEERAAGGVAVDARAGRPAGAVAVRARRGRRRARVRVRRRQRRRPRGRAHRDRLVRAARRATRSRGRGSCMPRPHFPTRAARLR